MSPIDLRSDTVTRPSTSMRRAMADAVVGDDVYGEDPTVNRLQEQVATLLGKEAALFVPSGSMANQIALKVHTQPGDNVIVGQSAHNMLFESGAAGAIAGVQLTVVGFDGRFTAAEVHDAHQDDDHHHAPTRLVCVENTHNMGGGLVWETEALEEVLDAAADLELATHLDGARLWNAAQASGRSLAQLADGFDTVAVCLSKGLGAPVGSVLCGSQSLVHRAHRIRKMLGGAMRQAGVLAAAGLYALEQTLPRLAEDHDNARFLAENLGTVTGLRVEPAAPRTNIVMAEVDANRCAAAELSARAAERGVLFHALGPQRIRLVTHLDVSRSDCERAAELITSLMS